MFCIVLCCSVISGQLSVLCLAVLLYCSYVAVLFLSIGVWSMEQINDDDADDDDDNDSNIVTWLKGSETYVTKVHH